MTYRRPKFPYPHYVDHESKKVWVYVASGWPTVMALPMWMDKYFYDLKGYKGSLCTEQFLTDLKK